MQLYSHTLFHFFSASNRLLLLAATPMVLSGCFEISNARGKVQALAQERQAVSQDIAAYDKHIEYYKSLLPAGTQITGSSDPYYETLSGYLQRIENELAEVKVNMASADSYYKTLREETSRVRPLQPAE